MNHPIWYLPVLSGSDLVALTQVLVAGIAVGGGLFCALTKVPVHRKRLPKLRASVLLVALLTLLSASREAVCRPLGGPDNPGRKQAPALYLTGGFFKPPPAPIIDNGTPAVRDRLLFEQNCTLCHTTRLVRERTSGWSRDRIRAALDQLNRLHPAMPDYQGTAREKDRLADYIYLLNQGNGDPGR
jgi:hypothetical protein